MQTQNATNRIAAHTNGASNGSASNGKHRRQRKANTSPVPPPVLTESLARRLHQAAQGRPTAHLVRLNVRSARWMLPLQAAHNRKHGSRYVRPRAEELAGGHTELTENGVAFNSKFQLIAGIGRCRSIEAAAAILELRGEDPETAHMDVWLMFNMPNTSLVYTNDSQPHQPHVAANLLGIDMPAEANRITRRVMRGIEHRPKEPNGRILRYYKAHRKSIDFTISLWRKADRNWLIPGANEIELQAIIARAHISGVGERVLTRAVAILNRAANDSAREQQLVKFGRAMNTWGAAFKGKHREWFYALVDLAIWAYVHRVEITEPIPMIPVPQKERDNPRNLSTAALRLFQAYEGVLSPLSAYVEGFPVPSPD